MTVNGTDLAYASTEANAEADYQQMANAADLGVTAILDYALGASTAGPGPVVAGAVMALVRFALRTMEAPPTVRNLIALLVPSISRAADQMVAAREA